MASSDTIADDGIGLDSSRTSRGFLAVLWQRKGLVLLGATLGLIAGALFYWQRPAVYQANAQILVIKKNPHPIAMPNDPRMTVVEDYMATHVVLLRSPLIIERAIKKKDLASLKTFENNGDPAGQILNSLAVSRDTKEVIGGGNSILLLSYRGPVADDCGKILAAIIDSYQEFLDITYRNVSDQTLELIQKARDFHKTDLAASKESYLKFRQETSVFWKSKDGVTVLLERVISLEKKHTEKRMYKEELQDRIKFLEQAVAEGKGPEALQAVLRGADKQAALLTKMMDDQLLPLLLQEKSLLETYGDDHPQVISVRNRITMVREHFEKSTLGEAKREKDPVRRHVNLLKEELREAELNVQSLDKLLKEAKDGAKNLINTELQEEHLHNDVIGKQQLYDKIIERLAQINIVRDSGGFDAQSLSMSATGAKVAPSAFHTIVAGVMLGLLAGIGLAYLADFTDKSFRNPDEVRLRLGLPLLGHVPYLQADADAAKKVQEGELALDPMLLALFRPKSLEAEAYRAIRTSLFFSVEGEGHRVLQVTSPNKGDGKSLMVSNLAISMAQSGKKVLVIDADCRRPRQHKIFGLPNTVGVATVLAKGVDWKDAMQVTPVDGLWIMPSGSIPPNPAELLSSPRFGEMLESARPEFDYVIVDTPPLLAVTDPCIVASRVDGLVLILRLSRQGRPHAERAKQILTSLGVKILGVVVNGVTRQSGTGIYNAEHYDYSETYEQPDGDDSNDGYYYHDEESAEAPKKAK
jgi:capsular exopolysaccharide synthesis family protein